MNRRLNPIQPGLLLCLALNFFTLDGQDSTYNYYYRIYFRDKGTYRTEDFSPSGLFSQRAVQRRQKEGISGLDYKDLPVFAGYLDTIASKGLKLQVREKDQKRSSKGHDTSDYGACSFTLLVAENSHGPAYDR